MRKIKIQLLKLSMLLVLACKVGEEKKPLNVLWLVAEDLSPFYLNAYGDPRAPTPNLNRLAKEGVVYTHNFSVSGVCSPSRATLATGLYPNSFGAQNMRTLDQQAANREAGIIDYQVVPPPEVKMVSEIMRENGYYTTNNANSVSTLLGEFNSERLPFYHRLDITLKKQFKFQNKSILEVVLSVTNAYNRNNIFYVNRVTNDEIYQFPLLPSFGLSYKF